MRGADLQDGRRGARPNDLQCDGISLADSGLGGPELDPDGGERPSGVRACLRDEPAGLGAIAEDEGFLRIGKGEP